MKNDTDIQYDTKYLDPAKLAKDYEPLIKSVYKKFNSYFNNYDDKMDLFSQVYFEFARLVEEYDPKRGVDFPCYIKRMLKQRTYHYVTKKLKVINHENVVDELSTTLDNVSVEDRNLELVEGLASISPDLELGQKQKKLLEGVLVERKSLEELAAEEGVEVKTLRTRLHFLCKKLEEHNNEMEAYYEFHKEQ